MDGWMYRLMQALISALRSPMRPSDFRAAQSVCVCVCVREGNALSGNYIQNAWHMQEQCHLQLNLTDVLQIIQSFPKTQNRSERLAFVKTLMLHSDRGKVSHDDSRICMIHLYWVAQSFRL